MPKKKKKGILLKIGMAQTPTQTVSWLEGQPGPDPMGLTRRLPTLVFLFVPFFFFFFLKFRDIYGFPKREISKLSSIFAKREQ
jgi:hypothetical protein